MVHSLYVPISNSGTNYVYLLYYMYVIVLRDIIAILVVNGTMLIYLNRLDYNSFVYLGVASNYDRTVDVYYYHTTKQQTFS